MAITTTTVYICDNPRCEKRMADEDNVVKIYRAGEEFDLCVLCAALLFNHMLDKEKTLAMIKWGNFVRGGFV